MAADTDAAEGSESSAFEFMSDWRSFAPIAFSNLLLSIVTLGIYLFWARARERRFLWANTRFIDERLEWTGPGLELFIGYVIAFFVLVLPLGAAQFGLQALSLQGYPGVAALLLLVLYVTITYLAGVAIFRALRYRLSRTFWHGIRGGSNDQGLAFGIEYLWRTFLGSLALGLLIPWSMISLWNARWNAMSFGPMEFESNARYEPIFGRYLLFYLAPLLLLVIGVVTAIAAFALGGSLPRPTDPSTVPTLFAAIFVIGYLLFFVLLGLVALVYYAAYFREAVGNLRLGGLEFVFTARTRDWIGLMIGNFALVVVTLGIGYIFIGYRNWTFFVRHVQAYGEVRIDELTQSTTGEPGQGEGILDAFDIGAF